MTNPYPPAPSHPAHSPENPAGITVAGFNVPPDLVNHLKTLDAGKLGGKPAGRLCIVDSAERLAELDPRHGLLAEVPTSTLAAPETENWLFTAADQFPGPYRDIVEVRRRIQTLAAEIDAIRAAFGHADRFGEGGIGDADQHGNATLYLPADFFDDFPPQPVAQSRALAAGSQNKQSLHPSGDNVFDQTFQTGDIKRVAVT